MRLCTSPRVRVSVLLSIVCLGLAGCGVGRVLSNAAYDLQHLELGRLNPFSDDLPPVRVEGATVAEVIAALPDVLPEDTGSQPAAAPVAAEAGHAAAGMTSAAPSSSGDPVAVPRSSAALDEVIARYEQVLPALSDERARFAVQKRVTDLKLERATFASDPVRYAEVIAAYEQLLRTVGSGAGADAASTAPALRYQLARARDLAGQSDAALADLDRIIAEAVPATDVAVLREAHFRRAEAAFARGDYAVSLDGGIEGMFAMHQQD